MTQFIIDSIKEWIVSNQTQPLSYFIEQIKSPIWFIPLIAPFLIMVFAFILVGLFTKMSEYNGKKVRTIRKANYIIAMCLGIGLYIMTFGGYILLLYVFQGGL